MNYYNKLKEYLVSRGNKKNMQNLVIIFIIGLIIVIAANFFFSPENSTPGYVEVKAVNSQEKSVSSPSTSSYEERLKQELVDVLSQIEGSGKVKAMIYFESGSESVPAFNYNDSTKVTEENDGNGGKRVTNEDTNSTSVVTTNEGGGSKPFILKEVNPKISGVIVIAEGAGNPDVKYRLYEAVKTVFNIEQYKVNIYPMQKNK